jgi:hypothetical protein
VQPLQGGPRWNTNHQKNEITVSSKKIRDFFNTGIPLIGEIFENVTAKSEFTYITVINFCCVLSPTGDIYGGILFGELFRPVLIGMQGLKQH